MTDKIYQPTIAGLRAFVAVAEKQQFGSAATTLGVSQSTLSQALSALEAGLGTQLLERSTRRVLLTTEGRQLLPRALAVVEAVDAFTAAAAGAADPLQASMRLGLIPTVAPYVLPTLLGGLAEQLPSLTLRVIEDQTERLLALLREGALDAALIALPATAGGVTAIPIYDEDFVLALPPEHPLRANAGCRRRRWLSCRCCCLTRATACATRRWTSAARRVCGRSWPIPARHRWRPRCNAWRRTGGDVDPAERGAGRGRQKPARARAIRRTPPRTTDRSGGSFLERQR